MTPIDDRRLRALRRFAIAITSLTVLGHGVLGFEQSVAHLLVALATTLGLELLLEGVRAWSAGTLPAWRPGWGRAIAFLLPAHITGLALAMLLYPGARFAPMVFAGTVAIGSKYLLRVRVGARTRHFLNPSNAGITATLLAFPHVGIAPPYAFTENVSGGWDWAIPSIVVITGTLLNARLTGRIPLILAWLGGFVAQGLFRALVFDAPYPACLVPMTGMAFLLFTFYMITDPGTTPESTTAQVGFGVAVAAGYGILIGGHVVFGTFFALTAVCAGRGLWIASRVPVAALGSLRWRAFVRIPMPPAPRRIS